MLVYQRVPSKSDRKFPESPPFRGAPGIRPHSATRALNGLETEFRKLIRGNFREILTDAERGAWGLCLECHRGLCSDDRLLRGCFYSFLGEIVGYHHQKTVEIRGLSVSRDGYFWSMVGD